MAQSRDRAGLSNHLDVLAVEDRLLAARLAVATSEAELRSGELALLRALGGGYADEGVARSEMEGTPDA